jgi:hypothetical protein
VNAAAHFTYHAEKYTGPKTEDDWGNKAQLIKKKR